MPALVAEIRLTLAAAQNQLGTEMGESVRIDSLVLCGRDAEDEQLAESVKAELGLPIALLDPFSGLSLAPSLSAAMPPHADRFAPLLGMLQAELRGTGHAIDFLNPRRRPPPVNRRKLWISFGATAAALLLGYLAVTRVSHYLLAAKVDQMTQDAKAMDASLLEAKKKTGEKYDHIRKWAEQETIWLDKLYALSRDVPPAREVVFDGVTMSSGQHGGSQSELIKGMIEIKGRSRSEATTGEMAEDVRSLVGTMIPKEGREDPASSPYPWRFDAMVMIEKEPDKYAAKVAPQSAPATPPAKATGVAPPKVSSASPAKSAAASRSPGTSTNPPAQPSSARPKASATRAAP